MTHNFKPPGFFLGTGKQLDKTKFFEELTSSSASVILVGENHDDHLAHAFELKILEAVNSSEKNCGLSLEFYDRESQTVLNEYLSDLIPLETFLSDSRPPANHEVYQPLIDYCKSEHLPVVASNCPRRYTRMVSKGGRDCLNVLSNTSACRLLPPLPYAGASEKYTQKFIDIMKSMGNNNPSVPTTMLDAQSLWDATMADSLHKYLEKSKRIVHVTGYFHIQYRLGLVEHLMLSRPELEMLTIVILPVEDPQTFSEEHLNIADLVILTDLEHL